MGVLAFHFGWRSYPLAGLQLSLFFQMTRITRDKGAFAKDARPVARHGDFQG